MSHPRIAQLTAWLRTQLGDATDVHLEGLNNVNFGYSAELLTATIVTVDLSGEHRQDVVIRLRPREPGLLEPYDLPVQFNTLRALEKTDVKAPRGLFLEPSGDVLGRPFFIMDRLPGGVYEWDVPADIARDTVRVRQMCVSLVEQLATIHRADVRAAGMVELYGDGSDFFNRELDRWGGEIERVKRGTLPALERLVAQLRATKPEPSAIGLVHGDAKPGNFAFVDGEVSAVFDWELAAVGDPLADLGYLETMWTPPLNIGIPGLPGVPTRDELAELYQNASGIEVRNREWYRAFAALRIATISLLGVALFDQGHTDDPRMATMALGIPILTAYGLQDLGVTEPLEDGPVGARPERVHELGLRLPGV